MGKFPSEPKFLIVNVAAFCMKTKTATKNRWQTAVRLIITFLFMFSKGTIVDIDFIFSIS